MPVAARWLLCWYALSIPKKTAGADLLAALDDIQRNQRLVCNQGTHGYGAYAWYPGEVPAAYHGDPLAVVEADDAAITQRVTAGGRFALIRPARIGLPCVSVRFL